MASTTRSARCCLLCFVASAPISLTIRKFKRPNIVDADPKIAYAEGRQIAITPIEVVDAPAPAKRRWGRLALMLSVPLLIAAVAGYFWLTGGRYVSTDNAYVQQDMVSISPDVSGRIVSVR